MVFFTTDAQISRDFRPPQKPARSRLYGKLETRRPAPGGVGTPSQIIPPKSGNLQVEGHLQDRRMTAVPGRYGAAASATLP